MHLTPLHRVILADYDVVSWDLDGTLYRMSAVQREMKRLVLRRVLSPRFLPVIWQLSMLQRQRKVMEAARRRGGALEDDGWTLDPTLRARLERSWYAPAIRAAGPWEGVVDLLDLFAQAGLRQVVVSDYEGDYKLEALGLGARFEATFAGERLGALKPSPAVFEAMVESMEVSPQRVLHLGDRPETDGIAATAAGCRVLIFDGGFTSPTELYRELVRRGVPSQS